MIFSILGKDLTGAQNLSKKHQALMVCVTLMENHVLNNLYVKIADVICSFFVLYKQSEMSGHETRIGNVIDYGKKMIEEGT